MHQSQSALSFTNITMKKFVGVVLVFEDKSKYGGERSLFLANALKPGSLDDPNPD